MRTLILLAPILTSCQMRVPNVPICVDKGAKGAVCAYTLGDEKITRVPILQWNKTKVGWFCMDPKSLGDYKTFVEQACQRDNQCIAGVRRILELENK